MRYLLVGLLVLSAGPLVAQVDRTTPSTSFGTVTVADAMTTLQTLIDQPAPKTLSPADRAAYQKHTEWLKSVLTRMETIGGVTSPRDAASGQASGRTAGRRQYAPIRFTKRMGDLCVTVETESRQFNTLSNASKARHDIAMNAIRNMK